MARTSALPVNLSPRLLNQAAAADYVSVSPGTFTKMIAEGKMPRARRLSENRIAWDRYELDAFIERLPHDGDETAAVENDPTWRHGT